MVVLAKFVYSNGFYGNGVIVNKRLNSIYEMVKCARRTSTTINVCAVRFIKSTSSDWLIARHFPSLCHFPFSFSRSILRCVYYYLNGSSFKVQRIFVCVCVLTLFAALTLSAIEIYSQFVFRMYRKYFFLFLRFVYFFFARATKWCSLSYFVFKHWGGGVRWVWVANWWTHKMLSCNEKWFDLWWMCKRLIKKRTNSTQANSTSSSQNSGDLLLATCQTKEVAGAGFLRAVENHFSTGSLQSIANAASLLIDINPDCTQFIIGELCDLFSFHFVCASMVSPLPSSFSVSHSFT